MIERPEDDDLFLRLARTERAEDDELFLRLTRFVDDYRSHNRGVLIKAHYWSAFYELDAVLSLHEQRISLLIHGVEEE